jgi:hypothetical protein
MADVDYRFEDAESRKEAGNGPVVTYEVWKYLGTDDGIASYEVIIDKVTDHQQASIVLGGYRHVHRGQVDPRKFSLRRITTEVLPE